MAKLKKLDLSERIIIQKVLEEGMSVSAIALEISRSISTVTREITNHITFKNSYGFGGSLNRCAFRSECIKHDLCAGMSHLCSKKKCSFCRKMNCNQSCPDFQVMKCPKLQHSPYVCNGCSSKGQCNLIKSLYIAENANYEALIIRSESRSGIALSEEEIHEFDQHNDESILQGDTVEGKKDGKCILTLTWVDWNFQIGFLRDHNNFSSVTNCAIYFMNHLVSISFLK